MKAYLTRQNSKTIEFVLLVADGKFVRKSIGRIGKSGIANSTLNAGSPEKAIDEINNETKKLIANGYKISDLPSHLVTEDVVFDKAKWHVNDKFPNDLDHYQSYVHTGLYVCWLIENNLYEEDFKNDNIQAIQQLLNRQIHPSEFYEQELDGVFDADGLTQGAIQFTNHYFDFTNGQYIPDYLAVIDPNHTLPSVFHVEDTWSNYDKLKGVLNRRFSEWKNMV